MQTHTPITTQSVPVLTWDAPARPMIERTHRWYVIAGVVVVVAAIYGIVTGSWSFAIVSVLAGGMYTLVHDHRPPMLHIELHDSGILLQNVFTRWDELAGFWFLTTPTYVELRFVPKQPRGEIVIQTATQDPAELRMILCQRIPELTNRKESILDILVRLCKI